MTKIEMSEAQKKRMESVSKYYVGHVRDLYEQAYQQGLQDPSRSEDMDKALEEVDQVLLKCWGQLEAGCKLSFEVENLIDKIRDVRKVNSSEGVG